MRGRARYALGKTHESLFLKNKIAMQKGIFNVDMEEMLWVRSKMARLVRIVVVFIMGAKFYR